MAPRSSSVAPGGPSGTLDGMVGKRSAGILLFRQPASGVEVLLGHLGGPFWARKDDGAWGIPKGELEPGEDPLAAARREFTEELGLPVPDGDLRPLGDVRQPGGKLVTIWALAADLDPATIVPGTFQMEWPPRSGRHQEYPELDRVAWFDLPTARQKILRGQVPFLNHLTTLLAAP